MGKKLPPLVPEVPFNISRASFSRIDTWLKCGRRWKFRYMDDLKRPPSIAMLEGTSFHEALKVTNDMKIKKGHYIKVTSMVECFMENFRQHVKDEAKTFKTKPKNLEWGGEREDHIFSRGKIFAADYMSGFATKVHPTAAENQVDHILTLPDGTKFPIKAGLDLEEEDAIWDYKFVKRMKTKQDAENSVQLSLYSIIRKIRRTGFVNFHKAKVPKVVPVLIKKTPWQLMWSLQVVAEAIKQINAGNFYLTSPENWWCSKKFCGYWDLCRGKTY